MDARPTDACAVDRSFRPARPPVSIAVTLALAVAISAPAWAREDGDTPPPAVDAPRMTPEMLQAGLLNAHPDLRWRLEAMADHEDGRFDVALVRFKRAARYADKPSAAMIAEMYWAGQGVPQDRATAYAWMDLAAERGWRLFLLRREAMWADLNESERKRALEVGEGIYADYGDAVAKPRKNKVLERARRNITGSRVGSVGALTVLVPGPGGLATRIRGDQFYHPTLWRPERYWAWQDAIWREPRAGTVDVGEIMAAEDAAQPDGERKERTD